MKIDAYASYPHYLSHIAPIWRALPPSLRGTFYIHPYLATDPITLDLNTRARRLPRNDTNPIIVAAYPDYRATGRRPVIFIEHGAGQTYIDQPTHSSYSGGRHRDRTILFICPNDTVAGRNQARYPKIPSAVVGCPRLDNFHPPKPRPAPSSPPTIAFSFHSHYGISPETRSSFPFFNSAVLDVSRIGLNVLGHGHPRAWPKLASFYSRHGIPHTTNPDLVLQDADCLVVDNSSFGFEAASLEIPLVWLSPPFYRRDVTQWPRFWDALILGEEATTSAGVPAAIERALAPTSLDCRAVRDNFLDSVYKYRDGKASERAVEAIMAAMS